MNCWYHVLKNIGLSKFRETQFRQPLINIWILFALLYKLWAVKFISIWKIWTIGQGEGTVWLPYVPTSINYVSRSQFWFFFKNELICYDFLDAIYACLIGTNKSARHQLIFVYTCASSTYIGDTTVSLIKKHAPYSVNCFSYRSK